MRWPQLGEYLEEYPEKVDLIGTQNISGIPEELKALFNEKSVAKVVKNGPTGVSLDADIIRQCALLRA
jgi:hypothetical protein